MGLGLITCVEEGLVGGVHTLLGGVVQVCHRLHVGEEEEKGRKVEQEVERESQGRGETHVMTMHMEMERLNNLEPRYVYVYEDETRQLR